MIFPRLSALSEVLWSPKELRNWDDFEKRLPRQFKRYDLWKVDYSRAYYDLKATILPTENREGLIWNLESKLPPNNTLILISVENPEKNKMIVPVEDLGNGDEKMLYKDSIFSEPSFQFKYIFPVLVTGNSNFLATLFVLPSPYDNRKNVYSAVAQKFSFNKATGKNITLTTPPVDNFPGNGGAFGLVNGAISERGLNSVEWLGWLGSGMEAKIDLGKQIKITRVSVHPMDQKRARFYQPSFVEAFSSLDGINYVSLGKVSSFQPQQDNTGSMSLSFTETNIRFLKVLAKNPGIIPDGQPGAGNPARMLIDEITAD